MAIWESQLQWNGKHFATFNSFTLEILRCALNDIIVILLKKEILKRDHPYRGKLSREPGAGMTTWEIRMTVCFISNR